MFERERTTRDRVGDLVDTFSSFGEPGVAGSSAGGSTGIGQATGAVFGAVFVIAVLWVAFLLLEVLFEMAVIEGAVVIVILRLHVFVVVFLRWHVFVIVVAFPMVTICAVFADAGGPWVSEFMLRREGRRGWCASGDAKVLDDGDVQVGDAGTDVQGQAAITQGPVVSKGAQSGADGLDSFEMGKNGLEIFRARRHDGGKRQTRRVARSAGRNVPVHPKLRLIIAVSLRLKVRRNVAHVIARLTECGSLAALHNIQSTL